MAGVQRRNGENGRSALGLVIVRNTGSILTLVLAVITGAVAFGLLQGQVNVAEKERAAMQEELKLVREILREQADTNGAIRVNVESTTRGVSTLITKIEDLQKELRDK